MEHTNVDRFEKFFISFVILLFVSLAFAVVKTAKEIENIVEENHERQERRHLPTECREYYNDGTDRWIKCMNVEHK